MNQDNVVKTEVIMSEESVHRVVVAEAGKALSQVPGFIENLIKEVLFYREPKRYSSDPKKPTFYEKVIQKTLQPMVEEEVKKIAEKNRKKLSAMIQRAFKSEIIDNAEFENRLVERLSKFSANISFYVSEN